MFLEDAAGMAFPLQQLRKLAVAGVNDLGSLKSETKPLSQAAATTQRGKLQTRALQKTAPPPVASSKPSTEAPKPLDISMPKLAAVKKLQLLLTKAGNVMQPPNNYQLLPAAPNITTTTPVQRAQNLHADKTDGNGAGGNMNAGSARINCGIDRIGPLGMDGTVNGNAGQFVRNSGSKLAVHKLAKLLRK